MASQVIDTEQNISEQLIHSNVKVESVAKRRTTHRIIPINGTRVSNQGYSPGEEIEFNISKKDLLDCQTLALSIDNAQVLPNTVAGGYDGSIGACIEDIEIYYGDKLVERIPNAGALYNAMTYGSSNDTYLTNEGTMAGWGLSTDGATGTNLMSIKGRAHKRKDGGFMLSLDITGLSKIKTFLPVYNHNLRLKIRLASNAKALDTDNAGATYTWKGVSLLCDFIEVSNEYLRQLEATMMGTGLSIPIQTVETYTRPMSDTTNNNFDINVSYSEVDSIFLLCKNKAEATNRGDLTNTCAIPNLESLTMDLGGHYLTTSDGLKGYHENYVSLMKSFGTLHDAHGSSVLNYTDYAQAMTLLGVNCESILASHNTLGAGVNARDLGYNLNIKLKTTADFGANKELICFVLHRKFINIFGGGVSTSE